MESITHHDGATPLDHDEIRGLKFKHITTRNQLDQLEKANIQNGLRWLARRKHSDIKTSWYSLAKDKTNENTIRYDTSHSIDK